MPQPRVNFPRWTIELLESTFTENQYPTLDERRQIADICRLDQLKVRVWFKNRRAKERNSDKKVKVEAKTLESSDEEDGLDILLASSPETETPQESSNTQDSHEPFPLDDLEDRLEAIYLLEGFPDPTLLLELSQDVEVSVTALLDWFRQRCFPCDRGPTSTTFLDRFCI